MFTKEHIEKIDKYLHENFDIIFDFEFDGLFLLFGGAVKDLIMDRPIKDLDFILLTQTEGNIEEFLEKNKIEYAMGPMCKCYRFFYNNIQIDITKTNDLYYAGNLNTDRLFYDLKRKQLIPIGISYAIEKKTIVDYYYQGYFKIKKRIKKAKSFINFMNKNKSKIKVKYKYNILFRLCRAFFKRPRKIVKFFAEE